MLSVLLDGELAGGPWRGSSEWGDGRLSPGGEVLGSWVGEVVGEKMVTFEARTADVGLLVGV